MPQNNSVPHDRQHNKQGTCLGLGDALKATNLSRDFRLETSGPLLVGKAWQQMVQQGKRAKVLEGRQESVNRPFTGEGSVPVRRKKEL